MSRLDLIRFILKQKKYLTIFVIGAISYIVAYYVILKYIALIELHNFFGTFTATYAYPAVALAITISILMGLNFSLLAFNLDKKQSLKEGSAMGVGVFASALATGCPSCAVGAFPLFMSFFGISASLGTLPLGGLELQTLSVGLLVISVFYLSKNESLCEVK